MDTLYFFGGVLVGSGLSYLWFLIGRNTGYQDRNVVPPPSPVRMPTIDNKRVNPMARMMVNDVDVDRSMGALGIGGEGSDE